MPSGIAKSRDRNAAAKLRPLHPTTQAARFELHSTKENAKVGSYDFNPVKV